MDYDVIVVGSGFGGAVTACRLAQAGMKVLILERGREWTKDSYPREIEDDWIWSHSEPEKYHGWLDLRVFKGMSVAQGAGVGGGSLIYANISRVPPESTFSRGWPAEITFADLAPFYAEVGRMLNVQKVPTNQTTPRMELMKEAATNIGDANRFEPLDLAVTFDPGLQYDFSQEPDISKTKILPNGFGALQGNCVHLGECDIGCRVYAKNTLDRNYIPQAVKYGAKVWPLHLVTNLERTDGGYCVYFDQFAYGDRIAGKVTATRVIVAAGSLGSTELLLRCRDITRSLPDLSPFLGRHWSSNGDFLTPALHLFHNIWSDRGPTIASAINYLDGSQHGQIFWVEDGGIPNVLNKYFQAVADRRKKEPGNAAWAEKLTPNAILQHLTLFSETHDLFRHIMPWFAQGVDAGDGELTLANGTLDLRWNINASLNLFNEIAAKHTQLAESTGGHPIPLPGWTFDKDLITPHPLGGCNMGTTAADGVVDHKGQVFNYPNLFVADGAIIPRPLGVNPSRTIGALAERIAHLLLTEI
jgi:cholesterol oxidase